MTIEIVLVMPALGVITVILREFILFHRWTKHLKRARSIYGLGNISVATALPRMQHHNIEQRSIIHG